MLFKFQTSPSVSYSFELLRRDGLKPLVSPHWKHLDPLDIEAKEAHETQGEIFPEKWRFDVAKKYLIQGWGIQDLHHRIVRKGNIQLQHK